MRKKYGIGLAIILFIMIFLFVFIYKLSYNKALLEMETRLLEECQDLDDCYYIKGMDGLVTVYFADEETVYEYTTIPVEDLPKEVQQDLKSGKKLDSLGEVYGFLENYSS